MRDMVSEWMNRPHLVEAWEYDRPPSRWRRYLRAQLDGEYSRPSIGSFLGTELDCVELCRAAKDSIAPRYSDDPLDIGLHAAIADPKFVSRDIRCTATAGRGQRLRTGATLPAHHVRG